jgi:hypothetical protein
MKSVDITSSTKLYDKRDDFNFPIVNIPFICSNIPAAPVYGVYISQLIRYCRACGSYQDFLDRGLLERKKHAFWNEMLNYNRNECFLEWNVE